jgi:urease accessory protein
MFAVSLLFDPDPLNPTQPRVDGGVRASFRERMHRSYVCDCEERDGYKIRFPKGSQDCEGVIINTGGGVAGGDRVTHSAALSAAASVTLTTAASERIYRSAASPSEIDVTITLAHGASLAWIPQETILYENSYLIRCFEIDMASSASLVMAEITVFGRKEMGETVTHGRYRDRWRIWRDGRPAFAENIRFEGDLDVALQRPAIGNCARVIATVLYAAPAAEDKLEAVRKAIAAPKSRIAASAWNGLLCIRCLGRDLEAVREDVSRAISTLRERPMPRVWRM